MSYLFGIATLLTIVGVIAICFHIYFKEEQHAKRPETVAEAELQSDRGPAWDALFGAVAAMPEHERLRAIRACSGMVRRLSQELGA